VQTTVQINREFFFNMSNQKMVSFLGHPVCYVNSNSDDLIYGQINIHSDFHREQTDIYSKINIRYCVYISGEDQPV